MADQLSKAQEDLMKFINDPVAARAFGATLAEIAVELMDAKAEVKHWKASFETVRDEIKVLASIAIRNSHEQRLIVTKAEFAKVPPNTELYVDMPEPGVRIYELRPHRSKVEDAVSSIIRAH